MIEWFKNLETAWQIAIFTVAAPIIISLIVWIIKILITKDNKTIAVNTKIKQTNNQPIGFGLGPTAQIEKGEVI